MRISDWSSDVCSSDLNYIARTPDIKSKLVVKAQGAVAAGSEFQVDSLETGWSSGRQTLKDGAAVELTLSKMGDNEFKRSEEHTSELQSLMRISYAVFCLKKTTYTYSCKQLTIRLTTTL